MLRPVEPQVGGRHRLRRPRLEQTRGEGRLVLGDPGVPARIAQQPVLVAAQDLLGARRGRPLGGDAGAGQQALRPAQRLRRHDQGRDALPPGTAGPAGAVQKPLCVRRQLGVDDQVEVRQVDPPRGDVGGDADPRPSVPHRLQRVAPFGLAQLARQAHDREAAIAEARGQPVHRRPGVGEDDGVLRLVEAQDVDDGGLGVLRRHPHRLIGDVGVLAPVRQGRHAHGVALVALRQRDDRRRHRGREHQRAPPLGRLLQHELQILAEAEVQHLVRLVEHHGAERPHVERAALDVVAQPAGGADHDVRPALQRPPLVPHVHAADAGRHPRPGPGIEPVQLAHHLQRQLSRRRDDERQRRRGRPQRLVLSEQRGRDGQTEPHGLARSRLGGHQQVGAFELGGGHRLLHRGQGVIAARGKRIGQRLDHGNDRSRDCERHAARRGTSIWRKEGDLARSDARVYGQTAPVRRRAPRPDRTGPRRRATGRGRPRPIPATLRQTKRLTTFSSRSCRPDRGSGLTFPASTGAPISASDASSRPRAPSASQPA